MKNIMYACFSILAICLAVFLITVTIETRKISAEMVEYVADAHEQQKQMREGAERASAILGNAITYGLTMSLRQEGLISPSEANRITSQAIEAISDESNVYGILIKAVNDKVMKESP